MHLPLLLALLTGAIHPNDPVGPAVYSGRTGNTSVKPPRLEGTITVDGVLDEPQWKSAVILTGFSQFTPVDGVAAADSTEVLVWYSATALHIGIRAFDATGTVRATLATRDQIFNDDNVQLYLSTFNDGRQATVFAVNPLGVQGDGALNEERQHQLQWRQLRDPDAAAAESLAGLRVGFQGPAHAAGIRGGNPDPVQESAIPADEDADVGTQHRARRPALRAGTDVDRRASRLFVIPRAIGKARGTHGSRRRARAWTSFRP